MKVAFTSTSSFRPTVSDLQESIQKQCKNLSQCSIAGSRFGASGEQKVMIKYRCENSEELSNSTCLSILPNNFDVKLVPEISNGGNYPSTLGNVRIAFQPSVDWERCPEYDASVFTGTITYDEQKQTFNVPKPGEICVVDFGTAPRTSVAKVFLPLFLFIILHLLLLLLTLLCACACLLMN